ncbi:MAG: IS630 family transposase [Proteobacteria bacterium]|nr:IS630 family transposase [Pseudomonadota bacterium]
MAALRRIIELSVGSTELIELEAIARSRTDWACRVQRARILLAYHADPSTYAVGEAIGVTHQTVQRCLDRAVRLGVMAALDDSPRPGREPTITDEARAWVVSLACQKPKDVDYPHELWTTRLLARHVRENAEIAGHPCLMRLAQGTVCKILDRHAVQPHKVRYYLERRDAAFEQKMAEVLCVYREVALMRESDDDQPNVAVISYDEKPGIQAIGSTAPDLPPQPGSHTGWAREYEYKRHGTLSLLAGIDLLSGKIHACVEERHRSREFIRFLKMLDAAYSTDTAIKLILDNHSAHVSKETNAWLAAQRKGRFTLVFTPKHGSWLNLVEGFFSKMARSVLRFIRVTSKAELKARILAYLDDLNRQPVVHTWTYKLDTVA